MHAILISAETLPKIQESSEIPESIMPAIERYYLPHKEDWYCITGYTTRFGSYEPYAILPSYIFRPTFDYDPDKIKTDWNIIVRKESP